jgi:hypothetical protein
LSKYATGACFALILNDNPKAPVSAAAGAKVYRVVTSGTGEIRFIEERNLRRVK